MYFVSNSVSVFILSNSCWHLSSQVTILSIPGRAKSPAAARHRCNIKSPSTAKITALLHSEILDETPAVSQFRKAEKKSRNFLYLDYLLFLSAFLFSCEVCFVNSAGKLISFVQGHSWWRGPTRNLILHWHMLEVCRAKSLEHTISRYHLILKTRIHVSQKTAREGDLEGQKEWGTWLEGSSLPPDRSQKKLLQQGCLHCLFKTCKKMTGENYTDSITRW